MNTKTGHETGAKLAAAISVCQIRAICGKNSVIPSQYRVIPSYYELFRVQKADRGTSRPAACPNAKGTRLYTRTLPRSLAPVRDEPSAFRSY